MKNSSFVFALVIAAALAGCGGASQNAVPAGPGTQSSAAQSALAGLQFEHACGAAAAGFARCHSVWARRPVNTPSGYAPSNLQAAYSLPSSTAGSGQTVAIVDAYDDPKAESDLAVYRSQFNLGACTTANGCFRKVDQDGGTNYPRADRGWAEEISLDVDMVSAICPKCHILLVEAKTNSFTNLATAVDRAATMGATEISNSYGGGEFADEVSDQSHYNHAGIAVTVSTGDSGYGVEFPAASRYVTAVGGTTLDLSGTTYSETVWSGAGSGCSAYISQPAWQAGLHANESSVCSMRMVADVSADADPQTGVSVYDSFHQFGWLVFGGTSVASPIVASVYALAGNASSVTYGSYPYAHATYSGGSQTLHDVTSGSNGSCGTFLCTGTVGYDGPTGLGTPHGTGAF